MSKTRVPNEYLASDMGRLNLLVNGGFEVWQRGNGPFTTTSSLCTDRWIVGLIGTDTLSVSKDTSNVDAAGGSQSCAACTFVLGSGAGVTNLSQICKATDGYQLSNRVVSLSVRVKTSTANAVRLGIHNGTAWTYSAFHSGGGTYETLTVSATIGASPAAAQISIFFNTSCTAYADNAMLVIGSIAADYVPMPSADELARCKRYYKIPYDPGAGGLNWTWWMGTGSSGTWDFPLDIEMAVSPSVTKGGTYSSSQMTSATFGATAKRFEITIVASGTGFGYVQSSTGTPVTFEANP